MFMKAGRKDGEKAGMKLLAWAVKRDVDRVERRWGNQGTREFCQAVETMMDAVLAAIERDELFVLYMARQPILRNFEESDDFYSRED